MSRPTRNDHGFTLAEVIVAMAVTLLVLSAAIDMFTRSTMLVGSSRIMSETNQGLQAAVSLMVRDFVQTGQGIPIGGIPIPSGAGASAIVRPGPAGLTLPGSWTALPALSPGASLGPTLLGVQTDVISILYADRTLNLSAQPLAAIAADGSTMTVAAATPITGADGLRIGDLILFSNPLGNALQMITQTNGTQTVTFGTGDPLNLNQPLASQGTILNLQSAAGVFPPTTATRVELISYYLDDVTEPTLPRLIRRVNAGQPLAIALGAENLQFSFDLVDGVTNPANVATPPAGNSPNQIRKINLFLSARSLTVDLQTRQVFRNSMATQVGLRSLSFVDRYQ